MPVQWQPNEWSQHPFQVWQRQKQRFDEPFDEMEIRKAIAAYYGMVTFLDHNIGKILAALKASGQLENTRVVYTTDHGEQLGEHGMWWKSSMLEASVGIPLIVAGPEIPEGKVSTTNVNLVDCFPGIVEAVGAELAPQDADLPGESVFRLAQQDDRERIVFSEYHAAVSPTAAFMIRTARFKYIAYVGMPPQLFDMEADRFEIHNLADDPNFADVLAECDEKLREICDPEAVDARAKASQRARIMESGGPEAVLAAGLKIPYTPAPDQFEPAPNENRERAKAARAANPA
jgi:choline-sulfatase